jgi:hypothetical protein
MRTTRSGGRRLKISTQSNHSTRTVRTHGLANAFARGARIGVMTMPTPSDWNTSSKGPEYLASRSLIANRILPSPSPTARFRPAESPTPSWGSGHAEDLDAMRPDLDGEEHVHGSDHQRLDGEKVTSARMPWACDRRNSLQVGPSLRGAGPKPFARSSLRIVVARLGSRAWRAHPGSAGILKARKPHIQFWRQARTRGLGHRTSSCLRTRAISAL